MADHVKDGALPIIHLNSPQIAQIIKKILPEDGEIFQDNNFSIVAMTSFISIKYFSTSSFEKPAVTS